MKTKAIVFPRKQQAKLVEHEVPELQTGQVLVETTVSLISTGTECICFRGEFDENTLWHNWVQYPFQPGYSAVGTVVEVGPAVLGLAEGDAVFTGKQHLNHTVVDEDNAIKLPDGVTHEEATWSMLASITQTAVRRAEHTMGDTAVLIGLGPLGQLVTQYLRTIGLRHVLAIDTVAMRLDAAAEHGATATFAGNAADAGDFVAAHTDGRLADVVYDVTGHWSVLPLALPLARDFGRVMLLGDSPHPSKQQLTRDVLTRQVNVVATHNIKLQPQFAWWTRQRQVELFYTYLQRGQLRVADLITHRHKPSEAHAVYPQLLNDRTGTLGCLFDWR